MQDMTPVSYVPTVFFDVVFAGGFIGMSGLFTSVSGLNMEFQYETYTEGGSNYPRHFFKQAAPQTLVLEQGTVTTVDTFSAWIMGINAGMAAVLNGVIILKDHTGEHKRVWTVVGAFPVKYVGPSLDSMRSNLAVSRIELLHNGCF